MPRFSKQSQARLVTCDIRIRYLFEEVVRHFDCTILEGHRDQEAQDRAFKEGKSKLKWPLSSHNTYPSKAVDVAPYPIDWQDTKRFYYFAGYVMGIAQQLHVPLRLPLRWGGDWDQDTILSDQNFNDLVHFELVEK